MKLSVSDSTEVEELYLLICSYAPGLVKFIPEDQMQNRMAILLCNLKPSKMRGIASEAMVMCASTPEKVCNIISGKNPIVF
jgi:tRNA-binding EMAP/Myf-like protein